MFNSIKQRTLAGQMLVSLTATIVITLLSYFLFKVHLEKTQDEHMQFIADSTASGISGSLENLKEMMDRITLSREFEEYNKYYRELPLAKHFSKFKNYIPTLAFLNEKGQEEVKTVKGEPSQNLSDHAGSRYFVQAMASPDKVIFSDFEKSGDTGEPAIKMFLSKRQYFGNEFTGALMGNIPLSIFDNHIEKINVGKRGVITIIDRNNKVLACSETEKHHIGETIDKNISKVFAGNGTEDLKRAALFDVDSVISSSRVESLGWTILVALPYEEYTAAINILIINVLIVFILVLLISLLISKKLSDRITNPVISLSSAAAKIGAGDLSQRVSVDSNDEVGRLAASFNNMLETLQQTVVSRETYQKQNEFLRDVVNSIPYPFFVVNISDLSVEMANAAASPSDDFERMPCYAMAEAADIPCIGNERKCDLLSIRETKNPVFIDCMHHDRKGNQQYCKICAYPVFDDKGDVRKIIEYSVDVSESKRAEMEIIMFAEKLRISNRELEEFAYIASHDLQEPLRKVTVFGDRLKAKYSGVLDEQGRDYLERMQGAARRMQNLINGLLMFSRVTTKGQPFVPVDLSAVTKEVLSDLEVRIEQTGAKVEAEDLTVLNGDPLQLRQLMQNLVGNALKFSQKDTPPVVKISGTFVNSNGEAPDTGASDKNLYQITVEDNGIGFDEKHTDRIFGMFQRLHSRQEYEGTGIGLSVCKKIVERHGGTITATSAPNSGAKFIMTFPVQQGD